MAGMAYGVVLGQNIRAARTAAGLSEGDIAERMRHLGYPAWLRQTVASAERGEYRLAADEVFAISIALYISVNALTLPPVDDPLEVILPGGQVIHFSPPLWWDGNKPTTIPQPIEKTRHE
jgi:transcriptional regulator with XRE-family HTH domain